MMQPVADRAGLAVDAGGVRLNLLPARALFWPDEKTLFVADVHLGKGALLRRSGIPVPAGSTRQDLQRLRELVGQNQVQRLVILGDLFHHRPVQGEPLFQLWPEWRASIAGCSVQLVAGNHDRYAQGVELSGLDWLEDGHELGPFMLRHAPARADGKLVLCGHVHPAVRLGRGRDRMRLPVFHVRPDMIVLPAFGSLTGGMVVARSPGDRLFLATDPVTEIPASFSL